MYAPFFFVVVDSSIPREIVDSEQEHENPKNSDKRKFVALYT